MNELLGRSAVVTGAGRGFGRAIAVALAGAGAAVTLTARTQSEIDGARAAILERGGRAQAVVADVTDLEAVRKVCELHRTQFGPVSILVNCAGSAEPYGPVGDVDVRRWWRTMSVNVLGPLNYMSAAIPQMLAAGRGCIINVSSLGATFVGGHDSAYCVSKATLLRLSEHVARERAAAGIAVFPVHPGIAYTALADAVVQSADARRWMPGLVAELEEVKNRGGQTQGLDLCGQHCVALASGRLDHLSGKFLTLDKAEITA